MHFFEVDRGEASSLAYASGTDSHSSRAPSRAADSLALALALALTVVPTRVPMAMVRTWTPETTLAHRTKGKVAL